MRRERRWKKNQMISVCLSLLLAVSMLAGSLPLSGLEVQAAEKESETQKTEDASVMKQAEESQETGNARASESSGSRFNHPGLLYTQEGFDKMWENVQNNVSPNKETWDALWWDSFSNPGWWPRPLEGVTRGGTGDSINQLRIDIKRAHQNALIWKISGDEAHGEAACRIINAWSANMKWLGGNADRFLAAGLQGYELANIGEIMRDHPNFDTEGLQNLLLNVFYPMNDDFMIRHNDAYIGNYWANWELANLASMISIGVFCDREDIYERALNYFKTGKGNGSLYHTMPYVFEEDGGLVQWQESVRDQGHTTLGLVLAGVIMETAWNQGDDLYSVSDNRFMKAIEYSVRFNSLGVRDIPTARYEYRKGKKGDSVWYNGTIDYQISWRPIYYQMYNHYVNRKGLEMPNTEQMIKNGTTENGPYMEGAPGKSLDELGWYSLTYANIGERVEDEPVEGELSDGVYRILNASSGKSLVVNEEGNLASAAKGTRKDEWWLVKNKGDGEYTLTNMATGKLMQINSTGDAEKHNGYYEYGTQIGTGKANGSLAQSFAFLAENDGFFRIVPSLNFLVLALEGNSTADNARIVQWRNDAWGAYWNSNNPAQRWTVEKATESEAAFTFDDEESGFETDYISLEGDCSLVKHGKGKALSLNGTSEYQTLVTTTGKSVVAGEPEFTISYETRPASGNENWVFYAAPEAKNQSQAQATYFGVKEKDGTVTAEICRNGSISKASADIREDVGAGSWYKVSVVYTKTETILYVNGKEMARTARDYAISDILGDDGIMQIGRANLGDGICYKGAIDNFKITGHAMTADEILTEAAEFAEGSLPETLIDFTFDDKETGFSGGTAIAKGSYTLEEHDGGKALRLDGWRDFLKVTKTDGSSLVSGGLLKEMTISLQVKKEGGTGWVLYAAPDNVSPAVNWEQYIGVMDSNGSITAQRFKNQGSRAVSAEGTGRKDIWHHIAVVYTEDKITIYDNGEKAAEAENDIPLYEILGGGSIWQIGKANWGTGEYFQGLIDNFKVVSRAWTEEEIRTEALKYVDKSQLQDAVEKQYAEEEEKYSQERERWQTYQTALQTAQTVLADEEAKQSAVDLATEGLNKVQAWMRIDEVLHDAIATDQESGYTVKSWEPYASALSEAESLYENEETDTGVTNEQVKAAAKALRDAQDALLGKNETIREAITRIDAIGEVELTPDCSRKVILARQACDLLVETELAQVTNLSDLETAEAAMKDYLLAFTFDDEDTGFIGGQAVAEGEYEIRNGALYLDGNGKWLNVVKGDGSSLLKGRDELTISFAASPVSGNSNWLFFAAPNANAQELNQENYLGLMEFEGTITTERYKNSGERPKSASAENVDTSNWIYVTLVCTAGKNTLYINGEEKASVDSDIALSDIFGENGVLQIGKGNWGNGEYYTGYLDDYTILGKALGADEIKAKADAYLGNALNLKKIEDTITQIDLIGLVQANIDVRTKIEQAREAYESLTEEEQKLVTNLDVLVNAEEIYREMAMDAEAVLGEISYDEESNSLKGTGVEIQTNGTPVFEDDAQRGKVLSLDGTGSVWLNVTKEDGSSLLSGSEELTVSYYSKAGRTDTNWAFYAAPNADTQKYGNEYYLGIMENGGKVKAERYLNGRQESPSAEYASGWNHIVVVYGANNVRIYVNGTLAKETANSGSLKEILGDSSVLQIGKANWGTGEYYQGLLDDVSIYNYAFTERDVKILRGEIANPRPIKNKILETKLINESYYTAESYVSLQAAVKTARKAVDTVTTDAEVTAAVAALQAAIDALERLPLDYESLTAKIAEAKGIVQGNYTDASFAALQTAITEAEQVMESAELQEEVDAQVGLLQKAIEDLQEKTPDNPDDPNKPDYPDDPNKPDNPDDPNKPDNPDDPNKPDNPDDPNNPGGSNDPNNPGGSNDPNDPNKLVALEMVKTIKAEQYPTSKYVKISFGSVKGAVSYEIFRSTKPAGKYNSIGNTKTTSFVDKKTATSKTYYYKVLAKAENETYNSAVSTAYAKVKVLARPSVKVKSARGRKITVSWKKIKGASGYKVYVSTKKNKGFKAVKTLKKARSVKTVIRAKKNVKTLYIKVRPYYTENKKNVQGAYSKTIRVKVKK